jgi:hypothetical protein
VILPCGTVPNLPLLRTYEVVGEVSSGIVLVSELRERKDPLLSVLLLRYHQVGSLPPRKPSLMVLVQVAKTAGEKQ